MNHRIHRKQRRCQAFTWRPESTNQKHAEVNKRKSPVSTSQSSLLTITHICCTVQFIPISKQVQVLKPLCPDQLACIDKFSLDQLIPKDQLIPDHCPTNQGQLKPNRFSPGQARPFLYHRTACIAIDGNLTKNHLDQLMNSLLRQLNIRPPSD